MRTWLLFLLSLLTPSTAPETEDLSDVFTERAIRETWSCGASLDPECGAAPSLEELQHERSLRGQR